MTVMVRFLRSVVNRVLPSLLHGDSLETSLRFSFLRFIYIVGLLIPLLVKSLNYNLGKKPSSRHIFITTLPFNPSEIRVRN